MIIAGEASGDMYGGRLVKSLKEMYPELDIFGVGGNAMAEAGHHAVLRVDGMVKEEKEIPLNLNPYK